MSEDREQGQDTAAARVRAKIARHFVDVVFATWGRPREQVRADVYLDAAAYDLGPLTVAQLTETFHAVRREWTKDYRPDVAEFRRAAARLGFFDAADKASDTEAARAEARRKAEGFQEAYMGSRRNPLVAEAWDSGFFREMRAYLVSEATRQYLAGATRLDIPFPDELVDGWRAQARAMRQAKGPMSPELQATVARIRENFARRSA